MKFAGNLLLILALALGALSAATAYMVPLSLPDDQLQGLTLKEDAGAAETDNGNILPLVPKKTILGENDIARLRQYQVPYIHVTEFSFARWPGKWVFLLSILGLLTGAVLVRTATQRQLAGASSAEAMEGPEKALLELQILLAEVRRTVSGAVTQTGLEALRERPQLEFILQRLSEAQRTHMPAFVEARPQLIARLGLAGFAEVMDRYAACERQINRSWSAAADGYYEEAVDCLNRACELVEQTIKALRRE